MKLFNSLLRYCGRTTPGGELSTIVREAVAYISVWRYLYGGLLESFVGAL